MKLYNIYKDLLVTKQLLEALPLSKAKKLASIKRNPNIEERLNLIFDKLKNSTKTQSSKRGDRIYIPFNQSNESQFSYDSEITNYLESNGYNVKDYKNGICTDKYDRELKIGKVLAKLNNQELLQKFNTDKGRESKNNVNSYMVFSKHSYDIGGASTDRGWTSCMNLFDGGNVRYILEDVKEGSFVVYLVSANDMNIQKPIARILVKPYVDVDDENNVLYSPTQKIYGTAPDNFLTSVNKILENIQKEKVGIFKFIKTLYKDAFGDQETITNISGAYKLDTKEKLEDFCTKVFGSDVKWSVNETLEIDIDSNIHTQRYDALVKHGKFVVKFGKVTNGFFNCSLSMLISLEGSPSKVEGAFYCSTNRITSLRGSPKEVSGHFYCDINQLKSLDGAPQEVGGRFHCDRNQLKSLDGAPKIVGGEFSCDANPDLPQDEIDAYKKSIGK